MQTHTKECDLCSNPYPFMCAECGPDDCEGTQHSKQQDAPDDCGCSEPVGKSLVWIGSGEDSKL